MSVTLIDELETFFDGSGVEVFEIIDDYQVILVNNVGDSLSIKAWFNDDGCLVIDYEPNNDIES